MAIRLYNGKFILLISASFTTIFSSIAIYFCLPILISHMIRTQLSVSPTSGSFAEWKSNSVVDKIYLYNITNLDELLAKNTRPLKPIIKLKEIGPFTFRQEREKLNIRFDPSNETVLYDQRKSWIFLPDLSFAKTIEDLNSTWINHINVPLAGTTLNAEFAEFVESMVNEFELKLFQNHSANVLLFEGYHDILMETAKSAGQIDIDRFGWMYNQNNSITRNIRVYTGPSNLTLEKFGSIQQFNFQTRWSTFHNNGSKPTDTTNVQCNDFTGASAGEFFPPPEGSLISHSRTRTRNAEPETSILDEINKSLEAANLTYLNVQHKSINQSEQKDQKSSQPQNLLMNLTSVTSTDEDKSILMHNIKTGKRISLFMPDICRVFHLIYNGTIDFKGLAVDRYIANRFTYDYSDEASTSGLNYKCYCIYSAPTRISTCPPNGMMDLFSCRKGSPTTISFPHFLHSRNDKTLQPYLTLFDDTDMATKPEDHEFFMDLESTLNIPVRAQVVLQFNIHFRDEPSLSFTKEFSFLMDRLKNSSIKLPHPPPISNSSRTNETTYDLYLPQMWFQSSVEVNDNNLDRLKFIQKRIGLVTPFMTVIIFGLGSILLMMAAKLAFDLTYGPRNEKSNARGSDVSLNQNDDSVLDAKKKYYAMQSMQDKQYQYSDFRNQASTSKMEDNLTISESQPLNS